MPNFVFARTPKLIFGPGNFRDLPKYIQGFGSNALIITGAVSFRQSARWGWLQDALADKRISWQDESVALEPTPGMVDQTVKTYSGQHLDVVVSIGGGSVIDAGKAVSAMLPLREPVMDYLEGVGSKKHPGVKIPFIAVPTTSGTGTEATKNASLRQVGRQGFKNSLRHDNFVPDVALVDAELAMDCPAHISASCGMDALAQLLESYVSPKASPLTDALARSGLSALREGLFPAFSEGSQNLAARIKMAYAAFLSGVSLANAGLGIVHSFSSLIGGYFDIPHGVICARLLPAGMRINIACLRKQASRNQLSLQKHAQAGALLTGRNIGNEADACDELVKILEVWVEQLKIPRLSDCGLMREDFDRILANVSNRDNPVQLNREELRSILELSY